MMGKKEPHQIIEIAERILPEVKKGSEDYEIIFLYLAKIAYTFNNLVGSNIVNFDLLWRDYCTLTNKN